VSYDRLSRIAARIADSGRFQVAITVVIIVNAIVLGLETNDALEDDYGTLFHTANDVFLGIFVVEIAIRIAAYGRRPSDYFRDGWNVFDFVIVGAAFLPFLRANATLLRVVRLLRVFRLLSVLPELRVVTVALGRSIAPMAGVGLMLIMLLYVYGMLGWMLFEKDDPEHWRNVGTAMLTLFQVLTLEGWNEIFDVVRGDNGAAWIYFVSFILLATFILFNMVIGIIVSSMEESRAIELRKLEEEAARTAGHSRQEELARRLRELRAAVDELERELIRDAAVGDGAAGTAGEAKYEAPERRS